MDKLTALRAIMDQTGLAAFILPRGDHYLGEYVAPHDERLAWLTGFTGSAGYAVILADQAWLFTDGRYQTQAPEEVNLTEYTIGHSGEVKLTEWLQTQPPQGGKIGYDPKLHSAAWVRAMAEKLALSSSTVDRRSKNLLGLNILDPRATRENDKWELIALDSNPIDTIWTHRPVRLITRVEIHPIEYSGVAHTDKIAAITKQLQQANCAALIVNDPTQIAWLLNIRGRAVPHTPIAQCQAIVYADGKVQLFIDPTDAAIALQKIWGEQISIQSEENIGAALKQFSATDKIWFDPNSTSAWHAQQLSAQLYEKPSPIIAARAIKNAVEITGARNAHQRDGKILTEFYQWIKNEAPKGRLTELSLDAELIKRRGGDPLYVEESFSAIIGWQAHGAIIHYRPTEKSNASIKGDGLLLIDCGAQYRDGTTDITRTLSIGTPTDFQRECYTRVLQGHIAIAHARFPVGTTGHQLDALARYALWQTGLNYDHGTGHGVGSFLSVHEGPQSISPRVNDIALQPGMILSNEPGFYKPGEFGIRLENLVLVQTDPNYPGFLYFETLTRVPFDETLIISEMLTTVEQQWLQDYQQFCH